MRRQCKQVALPCLRSRPGFLKDGKAWDQAREKGLQKGAGTFGQKESATLKLDLKHKASTACLATGLWWKADVRLRQGPVQAGGRRGTLLESELLHNGLSSSATEQMPRAHARPLGPHGETSKRPTRGGGGQRAVWRAQPGLGVGRPSTAQAPPLGRVLEVLVRTLPVHFQGESLVGFSAPLIGQQRQMKL